MLRAVCSRACVLFLVVVLPLGASCAKQTRQSPGRPAEFTTMAVAPRHPVFSSLVTIDHVMGGGWAAEAAAASLIPDRAPRRVLAVCGEEKP